MRQHVVPGGTWAGILGFLNFPGGTSSTMNHTCRAGLLACLVAVASASQAAAEIPAESVSGIPTGLPDFQRGLSPAILAIRPCDAKHWRQIEPALHHLALQHADRLAALPAAERTKTLARLAGFIDTLRAKTGGTPVLAPGRAIVGLLDPATGLGPGEITAITEAYGGSATIHKKDEAGETIAGVGDAFLAAVRTAAGGEAPATVIVLGHGLPTEIQSYGIRFERVADALLEGGVGRGRGRAGNGDMLDLGDLVLVCDDCFSADFLINLLGCLESRCRERSLALRSLPVCIAGTNRNCYGHADVGEKFVPHFWRDVIELYLIRRPHPKAVTLRHFFDNVDNMMYGYGRTPIIDGTTVSGWRLVDPELVQDPVVFVPLDAAETTELREILGLDADAPLARWLDVG